MDLRSCEIERHFCIIIYTSIVGNRALVYLALKLSLNLSTPPSNLGSSTAAGAEIDLFTAGGGGGGGGSGGGGTFRWGNERRGTGP